MSKNVELLSFKLGIVGFSLKDAQLPDIFIPRKSNVREAVNKLAKRFFFLLNMRFIDENLDPKHD